MNQPTGEQGQVPQETLEFYGAALDLLEHERIPFLVGGAYALYRYTGVSRDTKDLDIFLRPRDSEAALQAFGREGYHTDRTFPHWLGKVYSGGNILDLIHSSGNAVAEVDDGWFEHAAGATVLGRRVLLCPVEEMIWSKAFVMERERFDGADVNHLLRARARDLDWARLLRRFGSHWRLLLSHLILFGYVYPDEAGKVPAEVMRRLTDRLPHERRAAPSGKPLCRGTLLSRAQYLIDVEEWVSGRPAGARRQHEPRGAGRLDGGDRQRQPGARSVAGRWHVNCHPPSHQAAGALVPRVHPAGGGGPLDFEVLLGLGTKPGAGLQRGMGGTRAWPPEGSATPAPARRKRRPRPAPRFRVRAVRRGSNRGRWWSASRSRRP
jgi:hypothetical protein